MNSTRFGSCIGEKLEGSLRLAQNQVVPARVNGREPLTMRRERFWRKSALLAGVGLTLALGACSGDSFSKIDLGLAAPKLNPPTKDEPQHRIVTAEDLIGPNGRCAGEAMPDAAPQALNFTTGPQAAPAGAGPAPQAAPPAPAPVRTGVGFGMTECEVVRALGHTDRIEISTNERGQRSVTLTYVQGARPGIYRFVAGQLVSLERTGEPPPPPKAGPKKAAKKEPPG
jgi:hypothetical protein